MAIKKRPQRDEAAIAAFAEAADTPTTPERTDPLPASATPTRTVPRRVEWPEGTPRTLLIRYPDPDIPRELAELAALDDRSQHAIAVRALRRGLAIMRQEVE